MKFKFYLLLIVLLFLIIACSMQQAVKYQEFNFDEIYEAPQVYENNNRIDSEDVNLKTIETFVFYPKKQIFRFEWNSIYGDTKKEDNDEVEEEKEKEKEYNFDLDSKYYYHGEYRIEDDILSLYFFYQYHETIIPVDDKEIGLSTDNVFKEDFPVIKFQITQFDEYKVILNKISPDNERIDFSFDLNNEEFYRIN